MPLTLTHVCKLHRCVCNRVRMQTHFWGNLGYALPVAYIMDWEQHRKVNVIIQIKLLACLQALGLVLMQTWPRVPAHAQLVWDHLAEEYNATAASIPQLRHSHGDGKGFSSEPHHNCSPVSEDSIEDGTGSKSRLNGNSSESKENVLRAIVKAAEVLWRTGGKAFQEQMQQRTSENQNALLQSVVSVQNC